MNLFGINQNQNVSNIGNVSALSNSNVSDELANGLKALSTMNSGETLEGQVVGIEGDTVSVKIADNAVVNARLESAMGLVEGQTVIFQVQSGNDNSIALRPLFTNMAQGQIANNALVSAGLPVNATSLSMVSNLMSEGMNIDKNSIMNMYRDIMTNPDAAVDKLVHMTKLGLDINPANIEQYDSICNLNDSFSNSVNTIVNEIPIEINNMINNGDTEAAVSIFKDCVSLIADNNAGAGLEVASEATVLQTVAAENVASNVGTAPDDATKSTADMLKALMSNVQLEDEEAQLNQTNNNSSNISENAIDNIKGDVNFANVFGQDLNNINSEAELFNKLNELLEAGKINDKEIHSLIKNDDFSAMLKNELKDAWLLNPKDVEKGENVNDFYNKLNEHIHSIANSMDKVLGGNENLSQSLNQLNQNLQFLDQMSHIMPYVQLPLKMNGEAQTGDLYVYAKKKNLTDDSDNITALLRLDMKYLGFMEVFVKLEGTNNVTTDFCMEREDVIDFMEKNMDQLTDRLSDRGYNINANVRHKEVKEDVSKEFATNGSTPGGSVSTPSGNKIGHFRFDVRA